MLFENLHNLLIFCMLLCVVFGVIVIFAFFFVASPPYKTINFVYEIGDDQLSCEQIKKEIVQIDSKIKHNERIAKIAMLLSVLVWWPGAFFSEQRYHNIIFALRDRRERLVILHEEKNL